MWIRLEPQGSYHNTKEQWEGICELATDLTDEASDGAEMNGSKVSVAPGSIAYCLEDDKLYVKKSDNTWAEVGV